jgi:N6-L-threonylcarbamoyladenine synthase
LKTAILYCSKEVQANPKFIEENLNDIASIQYTIIGILMDKLKVATKQTGIKHCHWWWGSANSDSSGIKGWRK